MASVDRGPKTVPTEEDVEAFVASVADPVRRADARTMIDLMRRVTGQPPRMWGTAIIGFGSHHYRYPSGHEGDIAPVGFSPRKAATTIYLIDGIGGYGAMLRGLGPHKTSKGCLYIKRLDEVDLDVLAEVVRWSYAAATPATPTGPSSPSGQPGRSATS